MTFLSRYWNGLSTLTQRRVLSIAIVLGIAGLVVTASVVIVHAVSPNQDRAHVISGGSSWGSRLFNLWTAEYAKLTRTEAIQFVPTNSGRGWISLITGAYTFAGVDDPRSNEMEPPAANGDYVAVPTFLLGLAFVYNVEECRTAEPIVLSVLDFLDIYRSELVNWNDLALRHDENSCLQNVSRPILALKRSDPSGVNYALQMALNAYYPGSIAHPNMTWQLGGSGDVTVTRSEQLFYALSHKADSFGYITYYDSAVSTQAKVARLVNAGGHTVSLTPETLQAAAAQIFSADSPQPLSCPKCWPIMGSGHMIIKKDTLGIVKPTDPGEETSCLNIQAGAKFLRWILQDTTVSTRLDGIFAPTPSYDKNKALEALKTITCNGKSAIDTDWDAPRRAAARRNEIVAALVPLFILLTVGLIIIFAREHIYLRAINILERLGAAHLPPDSVRSHLLQDDGSFRTGDTSLFEARNPDQTPIELDSMSNSRNSETVSRPTNEQLAKNMIPVSDLTFGPMIGSGSFGEVYSGVYRHKPVAIKRMTSSTDPTASQMFLAEARSMLNIKHPHVLRLYALAVKSPYTYLVLEYCRHGALDDYLEKNRGKVSIEERLRFMLEASQGLSYVHQQGLTHRDVKLSNFLLTESMSVKVGDLGTAATSHDVHRTRVGTLDYCAPEVLDGQSYSNSCDVYSFGICLWRMFSDQPLYPDLTMYNIITKVVAGNRPPIDAITSSLLADLIQRCWKQNPSERPTMDQVTEALKAISSSDFISL